VLVINATNQFNTVASASTSERYGLACTLPLVPWREDLGVERARDHSHWTRGARRASHARCATPDVWERGGRAARLVGAKPHDIRAHG
jgi:hypothetical protein